MTDLNIEKLLRLITAPEGATESSPVPEQEIKNISASLPEVRDIFWTDKHSTIRPEENRVPAQPHWFAKLILKPFALKEARNLIAQIETLPHLRESGIRHFFDHQVPRLMELGLQYSENIQRQLEIARKTSSDMEITEPWYRLIQVACGDKDAILEALESV